jgi:hypothetical protein
MNFYKIFASNIPYQEKLYSGRSHTGIEDSVFINSHIVENVESSIKPLLKTNHDICIYLLESLAPLLDPVVEVIDGEYWVAVQAFDNNFVYSNPSTMEYAFHTTDTHYTFPSMGRYQTYGEMISGVADLWEVPT